MVCIGLLQPSFDYCDILMGYLPATLAERLQKFQNRVLSVLTNKRGG